MKDRQHIIIIGWDDFAKRVAGQIVTAGKNVIVISDNKEYVEEINKDKEIKQITAIHTEYYNFKKIAKADIDAALAVLINLTDDTEKLKYVIPFNKHFKNKQTVVPINNSNLKETFHNAGVHYPLSKNELSAKIISGFLFEKDVALYCKDLLASAEDENDYDVQQYKILADTPFCGKKYGEIFKQLRNKYNAVLIGLEKAGNSGKDRQLLKNPPNDTIIEEGNYIILIINGKTAVQIQKVLKIDEGKVLET